MLAGELNGEAFISTPADVAPALRVVIVNVCHSVGFDPVFRLEVQLQQTIVSLVAENLGIALVPESLRKVGSPGVAFV